METQTNILAVVPEIVVAKRKNWADLGEASHNLDLELQAMAQASLNKIKTIPTTIAEIPAARLLLAEVKRDSNTTVEKRKTITSRLDTITARLMQPEKTFASPIAIFEQAIIAVTKKEEQEQQIKKQKDAALVNCREYLTNHKNNTLSGFATKIIAAVDGAYTWALGAGEIDMEKLPAFIISALTKFSATHFAIPVPNNTFQLVTAEQYAALTKEVLVPVDAVYLADYANKLTYKFADYEIALANKGAALELARTEKEAADKVISEKAAAEQVAAKLSAVAITPNVVTNPVKALKSGWKVDMLPTLENSILVMAAFVGNINLTKDHVTKVSVWDAFTIGQQKTALAKCKTLDENFAPEGIVFISIDKL